MANTTKFDAEVVLEQTLKELGLLESDNWYVQEIKQQLSVMLEKMTSKQVYQLTALIRLVVLRCLKMDGNLPYFEQCKRAKELLND